MVKHSSRRPHPLTRVRIRLPPSTAATRLSPPAPATPRRPSVRRPPRSSSGPLRIRLPAGQTIQFQIGIESSVLPSGGTVTITQNGAPLFKDVPLFTPLPPIQLAPGQYVYVATYSGSNNFL